MGSKMLSALRERPSTSPIGAPSMVPMHMDAMIRPKLVKKSGVMDEALSMSTGMVASGVGSAGDPMIAPKAHQSTNTTTVPHM